MESTPPQGKLMMDRAGFGTSFTSDIENTESLLAKVATDSPAVSEVDRQRGRTHASFTEGAPGQIKVSSAYVTRDEALAMLQELDPGHRFSNLSNFTKTERTLLLVCLCRVGCNPPMCLLDEPLVVLLLVPQKPPSPSGN